MKLHELIAVLENMAPTAYAEDFDNVGLLTGDFNTGVSGVLVCHDALENVIDEAIAKNCNVVVCFHPIVFSGLKKITGKTYVERALLKAIKNDIAIYAVHTALDNHKNGVNKILCDAIGILNPKILIPKKDFIKKLVTYAPPENADTVREALFKAGAGSIGNYDRCSFNTPGTGTYRGNEDSNPTIGTRGAFTQTEETKIEVIFEKHLESKILKALLANHVYEEVAYEIYAVSNTHQNVGLGMVGELPTALSERDFLQHVKEVMQTGPIRHSAYCNKNVKKVAVLGGSGSFAISQAVASGADVFVTSDLKYHDYYQAENRLLLCDIGHFESERYTKNYIVDFLSEKLPNFAIILSEENTNPVKYF